MPLRVTIVSSGLAGLMALGCSGDVSDGVQPRDGDAGTQDADGVRDGGDGGTGRDGGDGGLPDGSCAVGQSTTIAASDFAVMTGELEGDTGGLGFDTLRALPGEPLDATVMVSGTDGPGAYMLQLLYHDESDGPGTAQVTVGDVEVAARTLDQDPGGDAPTADNLVSWDIADINLRPNDVLRITAQHQNGEGLRLRSVVLTCIGAVDPANLPDSDGMMMNLGKTVSHYTVEVSAAERVRGFGRAGLDDSTANAHIYRVTSLASENRVGTLRHAVTDGTAAPTGETAGTRIVVFDVAGVTEGRVQATRPRTYVAGQTAPGHVVVVGGAFDIRASHFVVRHVSVVYGSPESQSASDRGDGFSVVSGFDGSAEYRDVWVDQYLAAATTDEAVNTFSNGVAETNDVYFTNGVVIEAYRAPNTNGVWSNFHEANHNLGIFLGQRTNRYLVANNVIAGMRFRSPQAKMATRGVVVGNFIHDFQPRGSDLQPAPIQLSTTDDVGDTSGFPGGRDVAMTAVGNYAEPGSQTRDGGSTISGAIAERRANREAGSSVRFFGAGLNRFDRTVAGVISGGNALGPNGEDIVPQDIDGYDYIDAPDLWSDVQPTHPGDARAWCLDHAGPRPNERHALLQRTLGLLEAQAGNSWIDEARVPLYRDTPADPDDMFPSAGPTPWSPPADPFTEADNGFTNIENTLNELSDSIGGTPFGNVDRPVTTPTGGRLRIARDGTVEWQAPSGSTTPVELRIVFADGSTETRILR
ncbi:MAG: hypothetical protein AAGF12_05105 [Myxococcota bacterium]